MGLTKKILISILLYGLGLALTAQSLDNATINVEYKPETKENWFATYIPICIDIATLSVAIFAVAFTLPRLRKKLGEDHISNTLKDIQSANKKVNEEAQKLIDKYIPLTHINGKLTKEDLITESNNIKDVYYIALNGSSDVHTLLYYLKNTLVLFQKHYGEDQVPPMMTRNFYGYLISCLEDIIFYSTVVQMPSSAKTKKVPIIRKNIKRLVSYSNYDKFKHFHQGVIPDKNCSHLIFFTSHSNREYSLLRRSAYLAHESPVPLSIFLQAEKIYAPLILEHKDKETIGFRKKLHLIGYERIRKEKAEVISLMYSNISDFFSWGAHMDPEKLDIINFKDMALPLEGSPNHKLGESVSIMRAGYETIEIKINYSTLHHEYRLKKRLLRKISSSKLKFG